MIKINDGYVEISSMSEDENFFDFVNMCSIIGNFSKFNIDENVESKKIKDVIKVIIASCKIVDAYMRKRHIQDVPKIKYNEENLGRVIKFPQKEKNNDKS